VIRPTPKQVKMKERSYEQQRCALVTMSCSVALFLEKMEERSWLIPSTAMSIDPSFPRSAFQLKP